MNKLYTYFLFVTVFLVSQESSVFCAEKNRWEIIEKQGTKEEQEKKKENFWNNFEFEKGSKGDPILKNGKPVLENGEPVLEPGYIEKAFKNEGCASVRLPYELKELIIARRKSLIMKQLVPRMARYKRYNIYIVQSEILYQGKTWPPGIPIVPLHRGEVRPKKLQAQEGAECLPQVQFWCQYPFKVRLDDDKYGNENDFYMENNNKIINWKSIKFDGLNKQGYGIFWAERKLDNVLHLIHINPEEIALSKNVILYEHRLSNANVCTSLALGTDACAVGWKSKKKEGSSLCTLLALGEYAHVVDFKSKKKGRGRFLSLFKIVKESSCAKLERQKTVRVPDTIKYFKKLAYLTKRTLIGLSKDGQMYTIRADAKDSEKVFFHQKIKRDIQDFAVNVDDRKQLVLRDSENNIFYANLALLKWRLPCYRKIINRKDVHTSIEAEQVSIMDTRSGMGNMWFSKDVLEYMYTINNGWQKAWIRYELGDPMCAKKPSTMQMLKNTFGWGA